MKWLMLVLVGVGLSSCSSVTVTGLVEKPGKVRWFRDMTVHDAIAKAGGVTEFSKPLRVHVSDGFGGFVTNVQGRQKLQPDRHVRVWIRIDRPIKSWKAVE